MWRKDRHAPLLNTQQTLDMKEKYKSVRRDMVHIGYKRFQSNERNLGTLSEKIRKISGIVPKLLELFPDNLFLCGGSVLTTILRREFNGGHRAAHDFDIFFCCKNVDEAENILRVCLEMTNTPFPIKFSRYSVTVNHHGTKIQFIRRIYQEPSQILLGFDIWACQHGWNPKIGYFTIPTGALSLAINAFPIDPTKRSFSYGHRLFKYYRIKEFDILLPGVDINESDDIISADGKIQVICANGVFSDREWKARDEYGDDIYDIETSECSQGCIASNYRLYSEHFQSCQPGTQQDYECDTKYLRRMIKEEKYNLVTFETKNVETIFNPMEDGKFVLMVRKNCYQAVNETDSFPYDMIWSEIAGSASSVSNILFNLFSDKNERWKTKDPGSQGFGINNPMITSPKEWYGYDRPPYYAGIQPDVYVSLIQIWMEIWKGMPKDIFKMICRYVVIAEGQL